MEYTNFTLKHIYLTVYFSESVLRDYQQMRDFSEWFGRNQIRTTRNPILSQLVDSGHVVDGTKSFK